MRTRRSFFFTLSPVGRTKSLSNGVIEEFCRALAPTRVVVVGQSRPKINTPENCVDLTRQTSLLQLIWLVRVARFVVSVESGPMHIAAALTPNLLSIHTWTDPRRIGPYNPDAWVWKHGQLFRVQQLKMRRFENVAVVLNARMSRPWSNSFVHWFPSIRW